MNKIKMLDYNINKSIMAKQLQLTLIPSKKQKDIMRKYFGYILGVKPRNEVWLKYRTRYNKEILVARNEAKKKEKKNKKNIDVFDYTQYENPVVEFLEFMRIYAGQSIVINMIDKNTDYSSSTNENIPTEFNKWYKETGVWLIYKSSDELIWELYPTLKIYVYKASLNFTTKQIKQYFKEGTVNCLLQPIEAWAINCKDMVMSKKAEERYITILNKINKFKNNIGTNGISIDEMNEISKELQIDISVESALSTNNKYLEQSKAEKKPLKHFIFRNTRINHVELNEYLYLNNIETVEREKLMKIKKHLDDNNIYYEFKRDLDGISSINTLDITYNLSNEFFDMCNNFEIETGLINCYIDDIDDEKLSEFVKDGTHYNSTVDFNDHNNYIFDDINHHDMKAAYTNYNKYKYYKGFLGKITDFRLCNKIVAVGLYQIKNLILSNEVSLLLNKLVIYKDYNVYPSVELEFLIDRGCKFDIICGCWGVETLDIDFMNYPSMFLKYDGIKGYAKYVGKCDSHPLYKKFNIKGNKELSQTIEGSEYYKHGEITLKYKKQHNYHLAHFTAFILSYQRMQILDQLLNMNYNNLIRVCVDGIYYTGKETFANVFEPKTKKTFNNVASDSYISNLSYENKKWNLPEFRENINKELFIGAGGNGKTHLNLKDKGLMKVLYIAPSWKLATKKNNEYNVRSEVWHNILTSDCSIYGNIQRRYNTFIIDEVSMMTQQAKELIFSRYKNIKLIFCGDIGYQAPPFNKDNKPVTEISTTGFDKITELNKNYRFKCNELKNIISNVRQMIKINATNYKVNEYVKSKLQHLTIDELKKSYDINDMILCRSHDKKDIYTEMFKHINKWSIIKNSRSFKNGDIIIGEKPDASCKLRHAYTIHSIQGETAYNKLYIDFDKMYDKRILYTALSRATKLSDIYLIY